MNDAVLEGLRAALVGVPEAEKEELRAGLEQAGFRVSEMDPAAAPGEAEPYHLMVIDARAGAPLAEAVLLARRQQTGAALIALVAGGKVADAVAAMKAGASACLALPLARERLRASAASLKQSLDLEGQLERLRLSLRNRESDSGIVGQSPALLRSLELARLVAGYPLNVLITGESGAGKEAMAALVHRASLRAGKEFVAVDCGALAEDLADDELFGHRRGAFTGAESDRQGRMQAADGGTLFLDEVGNLPLSLQVKLLRVLQSQEIWPLGSDSPIRLDLRIIAATNEDLPGLVQAGRFRLDLYHRLNEFSLRVPSLRERREDIEALARYFIQSFCRSFKRPLLGLDPAAAGRLRAYAWPGNVRQLQNAMKQACILAKDQVSLAELPAELSEAFPTEPNDGGGPVFDEPAGVMPLWDAQKRVTEEVERRMISEAMLIARGDRFKASERLGLHQKTLARKLKAYGLAEVFGGEAGAD